MAWDVFQGGTQATGHTRGMNPYALGFAARISSYPCLTWEAVSEQGAKATGGRWGGACIHQWYLSADHSTIFINPGCSCAAGAEATGGEGGGGRGACKGGAEGSAQECGKGQGGRQAGRQGQGSRQAGRRKEAGAQEEGAGACQGGGQCRTPQGRQAAPQLSWCRDYDSVNPKRRDVSQGLLFLKP